MKFLSNVLITLSLLLSHAMCLVVAYCYRDLLCRVEHGGFSAPAELAFLYALPFAVVIILLLVLAHKLRRKKKQQQQTPPTQEA